MAQIMNIFVVMAAILTFAIGLTHSWLGEVKLLGPLLAPGTRQGLLEKSAFARRILRFAWHLTTLAWWGIAAMLAALSLSPIDRGGRIALAASAAIFFVTGLVILASSRGRHLAWPVCFAIAALATAPLL
jgi:hypothetical protein